jgi:hypothetical protein
MVDAKVTADNDATANAMDCMLLGIDAGKVLGRMEEIALGRQAIQRPTTQFLVDEHTAVSYFTMLAKRGCINKDAVDKLREEMDSMEAKHIWQDEESPLSLPEMHGIIERIKKILPGYSFIKF